MLLPLSDAAPVPGTRPWATYALLALCVLVFVPLRFSNQANVREGKRLLERAIGYHSEHSYLELDSRLEHLLPDLGAETEKPPTAGRRGQAPRRKGKGSDFMALEQVELDGLTRAGFDTLARLPYWRWGLVPSELSAKGLLGHLFLHAAWLPLLGNLVILFLAGSYLEGRWPQGLVPACYLASGMIAAGVFVLSNPEFPVPLTGASAGVAGLVGAFAVTFGTEKVSARYWLGPGREGTIEVPGLAVLGLWGVRETLSLISPEVLAPAGLGAWVAYSDHLAGLGVGVVFGSVLRFAVRDRQVLGLGQATPEIPSSNDARELASAREATEEGRPGEAWQTLRGAARANPGNRESVEALWALAQEEEREADAAPAMVRLVNRLSRDGEAVEAYELWTQLGEKCPGTPVPATTEILLAEALIAGEQPTEARQVLAAAASRVGPRDLPGTLARLAKLLDGPERVRVAHMALATPDLSPERRVELEALLPSPVATRRGVPAPEPAAEDGPAAARDPVVQPNPLQVVHAVPVGIRQGRLGMELEGGGRRVLPLRQIKGVAAAEVYDGGLKPEYVLDLVLDFPDSRAKPASVVRFHSARFDPRKLVPAEKDVGGALLSLAEQLLGSGGGMWLLGAQPTELRIYDSPADHQRELLAALRLHAGPS